MKFYKLAVLLSAGLLSACGGSEPQAPTAQNQSNTPKRDTISILQTADLHGQLDVHDELFYEDGEIVFKKRGGVAYIRSLFDSVKSENPNGTIILDGGDLIQGSAVAALSEGAAFPSIIQKMGYDFLIPGNWEVVYGKQAMMNVLQQYNTPVISANIYHEEDGKEVFPPYFVKEVKGVKLGFISYDDPEIPVRQNPSFSEGLRFDKIEENLAELITELKEEKGVDQLFLVTHLGIAKQVHLADDPALEQVDYVLGNDTHERIRQPLERNHAKVTEPGAFGSFVGRLDLIVENGKVVDEHYELMHVDPEKYDPNAEVQQAVAEAKAPYAETINEVLGYTSEPLYRYFVVENPMDNMITDAARWKTGADISLSNGFRFSPPLNPEAGQAAPITREYLWSMLPVNEYVKTGEASGQQIKDWLEQELHNVFAQNAMERFGGWMVRFSGMTVKFKAKNPKGERVQEILVDGELMDMEQQYTLSACRRDGEAMSTLCRLENCLATEVQDYTIHEAVAEYLAAKDTVAPQREGRAVALDLGDNVLSQLPGTDYQFH